MEYLWIALGSALGGMARYGVTVVSTERLGAAFPWGTLIANVVGSLVIGIIASLIATGRNPWDQENLQRFFVVGLLGGFTTFSSFSLQTMQLFEKGQATAALINIGASLLLCLVGVWLGLRLGRVLAG